MYKLLLFNATFEGETMVESSNVIAPYEVSLIEPNGITDLSLCEPTIEISALVFKIGKAELARVISPVHECKDCQR